MYNIDIIKPLRIYRGNFRLYPKNNKERRLNTLLLLNTSSVDENISIINDKNINLKIFSSYYSPLKENLTVNGVKRLYRFDQMSGYNRIKKETLLKNTKNTLSQYNNKNLVYDLSYYNNTIFNSGKSIPIRKKSISYINGIKNILDKNELKSYDKIYMIIPFNKSFNDFHGEVVKPDILNNPLSAIINLVYYENLDLQNLNNIEFILYNPSVNIFFKFNVKDLNKQTLSRFNALLRLNNKLIRKEALTPEEQALLDQTSFDTSEDIETIEKENTSETLKQSVRSKFKVETLTGDPISQEILDKIDDVIEQNVEEKMSNNKNVSIKDINDSLENNSELIGFIDDLKDERIKAAKSSRMTKRDELLRENMKKVKMTDNKTLEDILTEFNDLKIDYTEAKSDTLINETFKKSTLVDFEKSYNDKLLLKDQAEILSCFSDKNKDIQMYIKDIQREDTSDDFTFKETLTVQFEDSKRLRHTFKIDIPKIVDDKYFYINGNKKGIIKQLILKPVVKTAPDAVQIVTNYNKVFLMRYGQNISPKLLRFKKFLLEARIPNVSIKNGSCKLANTDYLTNLEYDEISSNFQNIEIGTDIFISFNQKVIREYIEELKLDISTLPHNLLPIGINKKTVILLNVDTNIVEGTNKDLVDFIVDLITKDNPDLKKQFLDAKIGKKFMYSRVSIMSKKIPLVVLLGYKDGLTTVLRKAGIKYEFSDKRRVLTGSEKNSKGIIQFADGYLIYDAYPFSNSLLMNAFLDIDTKMYNYDLFDSKEVYVDIIQNIVGTRTFAKGIDNFFQLFIDPITLNVLNDLNMPTDFTELFLYANRLLEDNMFTRESDLSNYRIRSNEIINVYLYMIMADAYALYKDTANASTPIKMTVPQDKLMKELLSSVLVEDKNILNPAIEVTNQCTYKGPSGYIIAKLYSNI